MGRPFTMRTDHSSLTWLFKCKAPRGQRDRWIAELSQYNIMMKHREERKHENADARSRMLVEIWLCDAFRAGVNL